MARVDSSELTKDEHDRTVLRVKYTPLKPKIRENQDLEAARISRDSIHHLMSKLVRKEKLEGKDHLVAPAVLITEGVHNNVYYSADELSKFPEAWDGRPVVMFHPQLQGHPISANSPQLVEEQTVGRVFNTKVATGLGPKHNLTGLRADVWIDIDKARNHVDGRKVLARLEGDEPVEVSTGLFTEDDIITNDWNGERYEAEAKNHRPDHLALLPGEKGACSWDDGAGMPRINVDKPVAKDEEESEELTDDEKAAKLTRRDSEQDAAAAQLTHDNGGSGSGNFGHAGRLGEIGGSAPGDGAGGEKKWPSHEEQKESRLGFAGTIQDKVAPEKMAATLKSVRESLMSEYDISEESADKYLKSSYGRHLADMLSKDPDDRDIDEATSDRSVKRTMKDFLYENSEELNAPGVAPIRDLLTEHSLDPSDETGFSIIGSGWVSSKDTVEKMSEAYEKGRDGDESALEAIVGEYLGTKNEEDPIGVALADESGKYSSSREDEDGRAWISVGSHAQAILDAYNQGAEEEGQKTINRAGGIKRKDNQDLEAAALTHTHGGP